jgi:hypothetical protein
MGQRVMKSNGLLAVALGAGIVFAGMFPVWYLMYGAPRVRTVADLSVHSHAK